MILRVRWRGALGEQAWMACIPVRVSTPKRDLMLAPGERVRLPGGKVRITVDVPGFTGIERGEDLPGDMPDDQETVIDLDCSALTRIAPATTASTPTRVAVRPSAWSSGPDTVVRLTGDRAEISFATGPGAAVPLAVDLSTPTMPRRRLAVPAVTQKADAQLVWRNQLASGSRPRIEPADPTGRLLMDYLLAGRGAAAAAAARAVEAFRGAAECLDWSAPSFTQLLIGYAYAADRDAVRLSAWCRRTGAAEHLGADGAVLAATAAYWSGDQQRARRLVTAAEGAPTVVYGGELALLLTALLDDDRRREEDSLPPDCVPVPLTSLHGSLLQLLSRADAGAATVSVATGRGAGLDLAAATLLRRWRQRARFVVSGWRYSHVFRSAPAQIRQVINKKGNAMASQLPTSSADGELPSSNRARGLSQVGVAVAAIAVAAWLIFSALLLFYAGRSTDIEWTRMAWVFGSVQAVAFSAAGALFGTSIQAGRVAQAEEQAKTATTIAEQRSAEAMKGRALGALLQAEAPSEIEAQPDGLRPMGPPAGDDTSDELRRRHAQLSRSLFGDLLG